MAVAREHNQSTESQAATTGAAAPVSAPAPSISASNLAPPAVRLNAGSRSTGAFSGAAGEPLPAPARNAIEGSFGADLGAVRVHTDSAAQQTAETLSARAFTFGNHIFLGAGERPTDLGLMAHEAAHVVQQDSAPMLQRSASGQSDSFEREAQAASTAVLRREPFNVQERTPGSRIQRFGFGAVLDHFAGKANIIPGFRMFTIILGVNPINMSRVERSAANILRALIEFIPGGALITQALDNHGVFDKVGAWVERQIQTLGMVGNSIKQALTQFIDSLKLSDALDLDGVWERAKRIFTEPIDRIISFGKGLGAEIIKFIKDAILMPLAKLAEGTGGWDLLIAVLGRNPITGEPVPRTAETLIGGFLKLIGQEEVWENMKKANAIARAWAWFQGAVNSLLGFVQQIPSMFVNAFKSLEIADIVLLPRAFLKVNAVFGNFLVSFISWAGNAVWNLLEIIFQVVSPATLEYIKRTGAALKSIFKNPLPFVNNLVKAAKLGFTNFGDNFLTHLKTGLINWLTGSLPGIYIPQALSLPEIGKFVLSVLGITWAQIRGKIVKALGPSGEKIMTALETAFDVIVALVKGGPAAAWEVIKEKLTNLKDMVIDGITGFVVDVVVKKAIPKLISMFIPGAGFISAIVSIYDTIKVFIEKLAKIAQTVKAFIDSIVAIAAGNITAAAKKVENTLAGLLSLAISFLAGFLGLGNVADKVMGIVKQVQIKVDQALDTAINWIVTKAKALFAKLFGKKDKPDERTEQQKLDDLDSAVTEATPLLYEKDASINKIQKRLPQIAKKYRLSAFRLIIDSERPDKEKIHLEAEINPKKPSDQAEIAIGKKRGDHVFATGLAKTISDVASHALAEIGSFSEGRGLAADLASCSHSLNLPAFELSVDKGEPASNADAHSLAFGTRSTAFKTSITSLISALKERREISEKDQIKRTALIDRSNHHINTAKLHAKLALGQFLDSALDEEAAAMMPEKGGEIASGKAVIESIRTIITAAIDKV